MRDEDIIRVGKRLLRLLAVHPAEGRRVVLILEDQSIVTVDLTDHLSKHQVFAPLEDDTNFEAVCLEEWGWAIYWPSAPMAAVPTDVLSSLPAVDAGS